MAKNKATDTGTALRNALARRGWTQTDLAQALGINSGTVNNWCTSRRRPNVTFALEIQSLLGLPLTTWAQRRQSVRAAA